LGLFRPTYRDKATKEKRECAVWYARYQLHGRKIVESTGCTKFEEARQWLRRREGATARNEPVRVKADRATFAEMADRLREDYRTNGKHLPTLEARLGHLLAAFGAMRMARLIPADVERYKTQRLDVGATNGTINRELEVLARAFRLGAKLGLLNATLGVRDHRLAEAPPRAGFFEREQYEAVRRELATGARHRDARPDLAVAVTIYHEFGWRLDEVLELETRHVNRDEGEHGTLRLDPGATKNDDPRVVYLTPEVRRLLDEQLGRVALLERQLGRKVRYVFPHLRGRRRGECVQDFPKAWASACKRAGCQGMRRHDFRRTAARNLVNAGVPERVAMTITGHRTRSMFDRYNIVSPAEQQEAARRIAVASEAAAQRVAASAPVVTPLVPRLVPARGMTRGFQAPRGTVAVEATSAETLETASV
jgi:integrase